MQNRYLSLDVFRGLTVTLMIVVNTPGNYETTFAPLKHATWDGFTPTDLVFPSFLFAVGNAMSFTLPKYQLLGSQAFIFKILKRTALIFLLGYLMYWFPFFYSNEQGGFSFSPIGETRIFGVLQRIGLCYGLAGLILYFFKERGALIFCVLALFGYWLLLLTFGDLTLAGNAVTKLDTFLFGTSHLYKGYGIPFDPEGLLSTLPAVVNVIAGYFAGKFIREKGNSYETITILMVSGAFLLFGAYLWNMVFPINKPIWSSSYVLHTVGLDLLILPILIFVIEIRKINNWTYFFEVFGRNTLFCYLLSELFIPVFSMIKIGGQPLFPWTFNHVFSPVFGDYMGSLMFAISYMLLVWLAGYFLDKRKIYIKV
ncbi:MAG: DUF1624 domain-containing protein [Verrucomicrobia bacterium]|nr:DUF1624 domain-containing protein [Cytophagales bacterium]